MNKIILLLVCLGLTGCKFTEVEKYKVYRGPQPKAEELEEAITKYGLKTVINLRGENTNAKWYQEEKEIVEKYNINLVNIGMSADRLPHRDDLIKLLDAFHNAPRPILIHCMAGVDRTGEASALYQMIFMGKSKEEALKMLSPEFGYFEEIKPAKKYFVRDVWQGEQWAREHYDPCTGEYKYYNTNTPECK